MGIKKQELEDDEEVNVSAKTRPTNKLKLIYEITTYRKMKMMMLNTLQLRIEPSSA